MSLNFRPKYLKRASLVLSSPLYCSALNPHCFLWFVFLPEVAQEFGPSGPGRCAAADPQRASTVHILSQLLRLRQCCCHLSLLKSVRAAFSFAPRGAAGDSVSDSARGVLSAGSREMGFGWVFGCGSWRGRKAGACLFYFVSH